MKKLIFYSFYFLNLLVIILLIIYRATFSLLWRGSCRFYPSCSKYALQAFSRTNFFSASYFVIIRLFKCQPFYCGDCFDEFKPDDC